MSRPLTKEERWEASERWRALAIIDKSIRDDKNVVEELTSHFVGRRLIEELTGDEVVLNKKNRRQDPSKVLPAWGKENAGREMTTEEIQRSLGFTYSITMKALKNPDYFYKVKRGLYKVYDGAGDREAAKIAAKKKVDAPATLI